MSDYDCVVGDVGKIYIIPDTHKPVKVVFSGDLSIVYCGNGVYKIYKKGKVEYRYELDTTARR